MPIHSSSSSTRIVSKPRVTAGSQTAQRALQILKLLSLHNAEGLTAQEIGAASGEERSAVQRALVTLQSEGLVHKGTDGHHYRLGVEAMHLGLAALKYSPLLYRYQFELQGIARLTGDTVFLSVRVNDYIFCVCRCDGSVPIRALRTKAGDVRVLGTTAGGIAMLAAQDDVDIRALHQRYESAFTQAKIDLAGLRRSIAQARRNRYAMLSDYIEDGVTSMGVVLGNEKQPFAAASITAATPRMGTERLDALYKLLRELSERSG